MQSASSVDVPEVCQRASVMGDTATYRVPILFDQIIQVSGSNIDGSGLEEFPVFVGHNIQRAHVFRVASIVKARFTGVLCEVSGLPRLRPEQVEIIIQVSVRLRKENSILVYPVQGIVRSVILVDKILLSTHKNACVDVEEFFIPLVRRVAD